ncbi:MAG: FkbM family methyltransferase [Thiobacillus sp.]|nr:FkbM family methyltransferase [Thiobacillus sp.]
MNNDDTTKPWGAFAPAGAARVLLLLKQWGLARGSAKKHLGRLWSRMGLGTPVDIRYAGLKFRVHPFDNTVENKMLFGSKLRDEQELSQLRSAVAGGGVFLDIGANIGYYALMAAHFGAGRVLAFEPNPRVYTRLRFNIAANALENRVKPLQMALGAETATMTLIVTEHDMGGSRIGNDGGEAGSAISVEMAPLRQVLQDEQIDRIDALKIDVEGMEDAVLFPFFETSPRPMWPRLLIIEHTSQQSWKRDILSWMLDSGYREIERNRSNAMLELNP